MIPQPLSVCPRTSTRLFSFAFPLPRYSLFVVLLRFPLFDYIRQVETRSTLTDENMLSTLANIGLAT
ncbi:unnamed protein product [Fusarium graminearum]|nr:unnamed protein product [Fusarium graminearum]